MAGVAITPAHFIPGLHYSPILADLKASNDAYVPFASPYVME